MYRVKDPVESGYTFVEILVALTILGIVIVPFLGFFTNSFSLITNSGNHTIALNLCRDKIETLKADGYLPVYTYYITENSKPFIENEIDHYPGMQRTTYLENIMIETEPQTALNPEILRINVTVTWNAAGREYSETLQAYLSER